MVTINCVEALKTSRYILLNTGLWPTLNVTRYNVMKLIFNLLFDAVFLSLIAHNIVNAITSNDAKELNWMICILIPTVNYTAKSFTLLINKTCFFSVMEDLNSEIFNSHNEKLNKHIQFIYKLSQLMLRYFIITMTTYVTVASFLPIVTNLRLMVPAPFDTGRFDIFYKIFHFLSAVFLATNSTCFDILFLTLMGLCIAQLNILQEKLEYVLEDCYGNIENVNLMIENHIKSCIVLHELINGFVKKLSILLSFPLFIQYTCGCFIICNTVLQLTIMGDQSTSNTLSICGYTAITVGQMTAYHWIGNEIIFKSNKIVESCYTSKWYELNTNSQKYLLLLMERAKRPLIVQMYGMVFTSLDSLGVVIKWAYSVFALIKTKYN